MTETAPVPETPTNPTKPTDVQVKTEVKMEAGAAASENDPAAANKPVAATEGPAEVKPEAGVKQEAVAVTDEDLGRIKQLLEFYFGDSNYRRDKFLQKEAANDADGALGGRGGGLFFLLIMYARAVDDECAHL
jgi:hypothetical protein